MTITSCTNPTLAYYAEHAQEFADSTVGVEFSQMQRKFEALLSPGAHILDFGCGSGRDTKHFLEAGYKVTAIDGSPELCEIAHALTGISIRNELFQDLSDVDTYDGIWACSSILHLPKTELPNVFALMARALKSPGVIYTSFKLGSFEGMRNGRYFTDFTEPELRSLIDSIPHLSIEELWTSGDVRPGREGEQWLNVLLRKA